MAKSTSRIKYFLDTNFKRAGLKAFKYFDKIRIIQNNRATMNVDAKVKQYQLYINGKIEAKSDQNYFSVSFLVDATQATTDRTK